MSTAPESQATPPTSTDMGEKIQSVSVVAHDGAILLGGGTGYAEFPFLTCGPFTPGVPGYPVMNQPYKITFAFDSDPSKLHTQTMVCHAAAPDSVFG